jgi:GNAT-family acetyltransferase (TIGR03103 family)
LSAPPTGLTAPATIEWDLPEGYDHLNRYSQVIVDEARRRGIHVEVLDPSTGELALSADGRRITTVESLSELTSAVAFRRCDHKGHTRRVLEREGLRIPAGRAATFDEGDVHFLDRWKDIVVKPARGEGGSGISVGVVDVAGLAAAREAARAVCPEVLLEQRCDGEDLRVVVIGGEVVAASVRRPPAVTGTGRHTVADLVGSLSRERSAATGGASQIPLDATTLEVVRAQGYDFDSVLPEDEVLPVRRTANVHTGGTIHDVTEDLHCDLAEVSVRAARAIAIPVLGLDLIVPAVDGPDYVIIEANEQPGLANHEPQPTVERFVDLLFPA